MNFETDIYTKIKKGEYDNKMFSPTKENYTKYNAYKKGNSVLGLCHDQANVYKNNGWLIEPDYDKEAYYKALQEYREENNRLIEQFKKDLFDEYGVSDNPKREKAFDMAWDRGHSCGYGGVVNYFDELVELIK